MWSSGEQAILNRRLLGIISSRESRPDLTSRSSKLLIQAASLNDVGFIGGWHSPLEEEALRILLANSVPIVFCVSKSLNRFVPPKQVDARIAQGQVLLLTHCSAKAKRISREASLRRNQLVMALAAALLVLSAPEGSSSLELAKSALHCGKPVLTPEHGLNKQLLTAGAVPATLENIERALG